MSFFVLMGIAATLPTYQLSAYELKGDFLNSKIPDDIHVYVKADKYSAKGFLKQHPYLKRKLNQDISLTFQLRRYLYGLQESPWEWNKTLNRKLTHIGFVRGQVDQ